MKNNKKREAIFEFITAYINKNGYAPSVRDIASSLGISSTATVAYNLDKLKEEGRLLKADYKNRSLTLPKSKNSATQEVALVGKIAAGSPILATQNIEETYTIPAHMFRGDNLFMLNVSGSSMIEAGIFDGDKIVVKQQNVANRGDIVVALIDDEATVKRFYPENGHVRLQPENSTMKPIIVPTCTILGVVVGSIRNF